MAKLNPYSLPRPERPVQTRTFADRGVELVLTLHPPDAADMMRANEGADQLWEMYVTGNEDRGPAPLPEPDIKISRPLFQFAALLAEMQCPADPGDVYTAVDLITLFVKLPRAWQGVQKWVGELIETWSRTRPN
jgi:hypothetical protein